MGGHIPIIFIESSITFFQREQTLCRQEQVIIPWFEWQHYIPQSFSACTA